MRGRSIAGLILGIISAVSGIVAIALSATGLHKK